MSGTSRSRVTITLGGSGQVVKRDGSSIHTPYMESPPLVGSKRPVQERLGNNADPYADFNYKRLRNDDRTANSVDDTYLRKDDLRFKIMQKNRSKQSQSSQPNVPDLRNILSRPAQSSTNSVITRDRMPESKDTRPRYPEPTSDGQHLKETRHRQPLIPMARNPSLHLSEIRAPDPRKQHMLEPREIGRTILATKDFGHPLPQRRESIPLTRMDTVISKHSPWTLERLRQRSPDESLATSRGPVAPNRRDILQEKLAVRAHDDVRMSTCINKDASPVGQMKTGAPVSAQLPQPRNLTQRSPYMVDDQVTVDSFLRSLGLEKYAILFKAEEVDMYSLKRMAERDLKELGIPMGPRKKILLALQPRLRQQA
ncbi:sterile alpha motif domain-containing family protein [Striga asiatica]|uniref:Sterile alpha motif domain-containing family protein n=1 Tax=Striga asiatica TaxID=4170 RepID=A0A5A7PI67_STRAF|nr:sterile alpha motif domain-containing family protein [Striga asiatica]